MAKKISQAGDVNNIRAETGEKLPKKATSSDSSGTKGGSVTNGVKLGQADKKGNMEGGEGRSGIGAQEGLKGEFNSGSSESTCYNHKRLPHTQR